jgi:hypothetical protein
MPIHVNTGSRNTKLPRLADETADVFPGSPLAVIGLMMEIVRARFLPDPAYPLPWVFTGDYRPEDDEDGEPLPEGSPRKIMVESAYNVEKSARDYYPAIYISRNGGAMTAVPSSVGDFVGQKKETQLRAYHCFAEMPITCECESENSGESSTIGEIVWSYILTCRQIIREEFGFQTVSHPILGDTIPTERSKEIWVSPVQFSVSFDERWSTIPHAPVLRDLGVRLRGRNGAEGYLTTLALRE